MNKWYLIILVILGLVSSCGLLKDKNTERKKESFQFLDKTTIQEKAPGANKGCPSFDISNWLKEIGIDEKNIGL